MAVDAAPAFLEAQNIHEMVRESGGIFHTIVQRVAAYFAQKRKIHTGQDGLKPLEGSGGK